MNKALMIGLIVVVTAALIGGFMAVGGPGYARLEKADAERAGDLGRLHGYLQCRQIAKTLPQSLDEENYCPAYYRSAPITDPVTDEPYIYRRLDDRRFEVCAVFATDSEKRRRRGRYNGIVFKGQIGCRQDVVVDPAGSAVAPKS